MRKETVYQLNEAGEVAQIQERFYLLGLRIFTKNCINKVRRL